MARSATKEGFKVKGFSRVRILEDGKILGDSGWTGPNTVVNLGFKNYLCQLLGAEAASKQIGYMSLGEGTEPGVTDTTLQSECSGTNNVPIRAAVTAASSGSKTERFTATFASSNSFVTATENISNIGLFNATTSNDTIFAGNTFASSSCATNQEVQCTYDIEFS